MRAVTYESYGSPDVLRLEDVARPVPKDNEVLIRVHAASANAADWRLLRGSPFIVRFAGLRLLRPRRSVLGLDVAGRVEAVGPAVRRFVPGDAVFGCGRGSFAEYACVTEDRLATIPPGVTFEAAAAVPVAALTALQGLRDKGQITAGQRVLINGASGGVGTFAVQIARAFGAEVTGVCSAGKVEMVRSLGADRVIDYGKVDFTRSGERYDLIFVANGHHSIWACRRALAAGGTHVVAGGALAPLFQAMLVGPFLSPFGGKKSCTVFADARSNDMDVLRGLLETGAIRPVIERRYPLAAVPDAIRYVEAGHAGGKIVITVDGAGGS